MRQTSTAISLSRLVRHLALEAEGEFRDAADLPDPLLRRHGLAPLAYRVGIDRFRKDFLSSAVLAAQRGQNLSEAVAALRAADIPVVFIKGISYCRTIYADPAERPMSDIDLLVPPARHAAAARVLLGLGYENLSARAASSRLHHALSMLRRGSAIDLHRRIIQPLRSRIDSSEMFARARPAAERDDGALRLDPIDEALVHFVHVARHELRVPALSYVDGARLLRRLPSGGRAALHERARALRLGRAVRAAVAMTEALTVAGASWRPDSLARRALLPRPTDVLAFESVWRPLQLVRKVLLLEGPVELLGLAGVLVHEQTSALLDPRWRREP